ncbi:TPA: hypothetical protein NJ590_004567 [Vibrio parahaemolyticus]|uniref:hypothetical protein n=1 Tax=Vibrio parahaemolyticus TaxID=670 RepID=UPI00111E3181|nr:hypothetical protein [Vibrio parahaemolyticus]ELJ8875687.1 hypothetical protein [Vibrio parahaemolyticus]MDF4677413.1 hypothetical protein [Vibrio parahaemolyticus]MDF4701583.1 hypothetical protein [Vibrio parahaemolyticus]TON07007.1 hypothetical protein CGH63_24235 [Vibrio parahaemolyticus]TOO33334.1 hypothetical protein CGH39_22950 [Vibrio parahaemolyticus]
MVTVSNHAKEKIESVKEKLGSAFQTEDDLGVVIRAHIVLESLVDEFIFSKTVCNKSLSRMKMTFEQKVLLAIALGFDSRFEKPLKAIATIRNRFAHNLRGNIDKSDTNNFYKAFSNVDKTIMQRQFFNGSEQVESLLEKEPTKTKFGIYVMSLTIAITSFNLAQENTESSGIIA